MMKPLAKRSKRIERSRLTTQFRNAKGELCNAIDCTHCAGRMPECPECKGKGILITRVSTP